ncbi:SGNH/GDSL hydrolase family protein [Microvirga sp. 3-52]|nr:SGNH/GDSL hydrolase family protein [Microvirga sp. 3-52]
MHRTSDHIPPERSWGRSPYSLLLAIGFVSLSVLSGTAVRAQDGQTWVGSWMASPQPLWDGDFPLPTNVPFNLWKQTIRMVTRVSLGGHQVRVTVSNEYGSHPLVIGAAGIALAAGEAKTVPGSGRPLTFGGQPTVTIPPGAKVVSDPANLDIAALGGVAVSLYLPEQTPVSTFHWEGRQAAYIGSGNLVAADNIPATATLDSRVFLSGILVNAKDARTVVTLGDSITDGAGSTPDANRRWPDFLAERLVGQNVAVLNAGISGAQVLRDKMGVNALARFERDVLSQPGVKAVIVLLGINDIGWPESDLAPRASKVRAEDMIAVYRQLITQARIHHVRIIGATLTPFEGSLEDTPIEHYYSAEKDKIRHAVNAWIRTSGEFDAIVDFDAVTRDPEHPERFLGKFDSGDHLHPGDEGYRAMADAVDLQALLGSP